MEMGPILATRAYQNGRVNKPTITRPSPGSWGTRLASRRLAVPAFPLVIQRFPCTTKLKGFTYTIFSLSRWNKGFFFSLSLPISEKRGHKESYTLFLQPSLPKCTLWRLFGCLKSWYLSVVWSKLYKLPVFSPAFLGHFFRSLKAILKNCTSNQFLAKSDPLKNPFTCTVLTKPSLGIRTP